MEGKKTRINGKCPKLEKKNKKNKKKPKTNVKRIEENKNKKRNTKQYILQKWPLAEDKQIKLSEKK